VQLLPRPNGPILKGDFSSQFCSRSLSAQLPNLHLRYQQMSVQKADAGPCHDPRRHLRLAHCPWQNHGMTEIAPIATVMTRQLPPRTAPQPPYDKTGLSLNTSFNDRGKCAKRTAARFSMKSCADTPQYAPSCAAQRPARESNLPHPTLDTHFPRFTALSAHLFADASILA